MIDLVLNPLQYAFMVRGFGAAVLVGVVCAVVGTFVVLRGMAFFGDALAHAILPGVAIGYLAGGGAREPLFWWALAMSLVTSLGIGAVSRSTKIKEDTAIGVIFAGMFALGIALISSARNYTVDLTHFLFGNVLGVSSSDFRFTAIFGGVIVVIVIALFKEFTVISFDPVLAATLRLPARLLDYLLFALIAVTIVVSLQTVGVALMVAMLVTPAATAFLLTNRLKKMMALAAAIAIVSGIVGLYLSYYMNIASGAAIVLTCTGFFVLAWGVQTLHRKLLKRAV
ncbi:MAG: metal ABC transporter permease [Anaerolineaceae bacterium]|nr:metal ABC transporter permease [Anaerolineaceae bacterium]